MPNNSENMHGVDVKRKILIADDEMINREILGQILQDDYDLLFAKDGAETMEEIRRNKDSLSMVLLDILMPVMSGLEVLQALKEENALPKIPVIVTTADRSTEIESLNLGASDFIPKPYPDPGVIRARVQRIIELSEDRDIIRSTERDPLTGLYNRDYFYRYAEQFDQFHPELETDAVIVDVNHFHLINERYGKAYGDEVLRRIGEQVREIVRGDGGIVCRRGADTFMVYCPHREDYQAIMENASIRLAVDDSSENRIRLRMGVYYSVDKSIDIERRFDRAKMAADTVRGTFTQNIGIYDNSLHEKQLYAEQLIEDFPAAVSENQFQVYYQPKFDVRPDTPVLSSAEALVRWIHPKLGMISPGVFIPLFEENGLIQKLDTYVWKETARQIRDWKERLGYAVPVSVNVSRIDMFDPSLPDRLQEILKEQNLSGRDLLLEVTESAYTQDSGQIVEMAQKLQAMDFQIEMDDFGTGYSSLNMISSLPIDALKLDMHFIRNAFQEGGNTHMLEVIIGIADFLSVPVIAEGVETDEQLRALKVLGCDLVQGYFFSKPVPATDFEAFILQKKEVDALQAQRTLQQDREKEVLKKEQIHIAVPSEQDDIKQRIAGADAAAVPAQEPDGQTRESSFADLGEVHTGIQLKTASIFFVVLALLAAVALMTADFSVTRGYRRMEDASDRYISAQLAAADLESGSDYLTDRVRCFVVTGELDYLRDFFEEVEVTRRRDKAVENLETLLSGGNSTALASLNTALGLSNELILTEHHAMRLIVETGEYDTSQLPEEILSFQLSPEDLALSPEEMKEKAQSLVFNNNYMHYKDRIRESVNLCTQSLIQTSSQALEQASAKLSLLVQIQSGLTVLFLLIVLAIVTLITRLVRMPLTSMVRKMQERVPAPLKGVEELRFVTRTYNRILEENEKARERLSHAASHDALTGLFNRGAYDLLMESADREHMALILIDVDKFKEVNDNYGHAVGDRVLRRVADILRSSFRSVDILCRIGGDEFAVVMTRVNSSVKQIVRSKIDRANEMLQHPVDDLPPVSLSVGVAFSDRKNPQGDIFRDADTALYKVKNGGRKGCAFYE